MGGEASPTMIGRFDDKPEDERAGDDRLAPPPSARFRTSHAIVVGIDGYDGDIPPLRNAVRDALEVGRVLGSEHGFDVQGRFDHAATRLALLGLLREELEPKVDARDRIIVYLAVHGVSVPSNDGPDGYLLLADACRGDLATYLSMHELHDALLALPCAHALVVLDCCFAGTFRWTTTRDAVSTRVFRQSYDRFVESPAWQVITSAASDQRAFDVLSERPGPATRHSPFASAFLDGLTGAADLDHDNLITATDLYQFTRRRVEIETEHLARLQTPGIFPLRKHDRGEFVFQVPGGRLALQSADPPTLGRNPYRGLASFDKQDAALFFGRGDVIAALAAAVSGARFVVVTGPSGTGKSSLVAAGIVPLLHQQGWRIAAARRPGAVPLAALGMIAGELDPAAPPSPPLDHWRAALDALPRDTRTLVIIDQLEELATLCTDTGEERRFLEALADGLDRAPSLHVVVTVRADVEPQFQVGPIAAWWHAGRFVMPPMSRADLHEVIEGPAHALAMYFEPAGLVDRLIDDVISSSAPLPLLSFALDEMYRARWKRHDVDRALREEDYRTIGFVARALTNRATGIHDELARDPACAITIRNVMLRMVSTAAGELARRRVPRDELVFADAGEDARVQRVLDRFGEARLITLGSEADPELDATPPTRAYAEPAHDELISGWGQIRTWLAEQQGVRVLLQQLGAAAETWRRAAEDPELLWSADPRLSQAVALADQPARTLNGRETAFVRASMRRHTRRRRILICVVTAVIAVLATAAALAEWQRRLAEDRLAENRQLLGVSLTDQARQFVVDEQPLRALTYLSRARGLGAGSPPLRMMFALATRHLWQFEVRHAGSVQSATFSLDGRAIATASYDGTARIWDAQTGAPRTPLLPHDGPVTIARFSPDGLRALTAGRDGTVKLWNARTGALLQALSHPAFVVAAEFSPDGRRIATACDDGILRLWDAELGRPIEREAPMRHPDGISSAALAADGRRMLAASRDGTVHVWDLETGSPVASVVHRGAEVVAFSPVADRFVTAGNGESTSEWTARVWTVRGERVTEVSHGSAIRVARFSPDGKQLLTASNDGFAMVWDAATGKERSEPMSHRDLVIAAQFSPDGARIATGCYDGTARIWDTATGIPLTPWLELGGSVDDVMFAPDGASLLTASADRTARLWHASGVPLVIDTRAFRMARAVALDRDGTRVLAVGDHAVGLWDATTGAAVTPPLTHDAKIADAALADDARHAVTAAADGKIRIWDLAQPGADPLVVSAPGVSLVRFTADGSRLVTASGDRAQVRDVATGRPLDIAVDHGTRIVAIEPSRDGTRFLTVGGKVVQEWDLASGARRRGPWVSPVETVQAARYDTAGDLVAVINGDEVRVWPAAVGRGPISHRDLIKAVSFAPGGARLATASSDDSARIWDVATGRAIGLPMLHVGDLSAVDWSPDGTRIVTASFDRTVRIWDAATGEPLAPPLRHASLVATVRFAAGGTRIVTLAAGKVHVWELPLDDRTAEVWSTIAERYGFGARPGAALFESRLAAPPPSSTSAAALMRASNLLASGIAALPQQLALASDHGREAARLYAQAGRRGTEATRVRWFLAVVAALGGDTAAARRVLADDAPAGDAALFVALARFASGDLGRPEVAIRLGPLPP